MIRLAQPPRAAAGKGWAVLNLKLLKSKKLGLRDCWAEYGSI